MKKLIDAYTSYWLLVLGAIVFALLVGPWAESKASPVLAFSVVDTTCQGGCVTVSGTLDKRRDCAFIETYARISRDGGISRIALIEYRGEKLGMKLSRPLGVQAWGPWYVAATPGDRVELYARHQCHPFWVTETRLAQVVVP